MKYLVLLCAMICMSCSFNDEQKINENNKIDLNYRSVEYTKNNAVLAVSKFTYDGHQYISFDGYAKYSIVHDPDCPCHGEH